MIAKQAGDGVAPYTSLDVPRYSADRVFRPAGFYGLRELSLPDVSQDTLYVGLDLPVKRRPLERLDGFEAREFLQKWVERSLVDCKWIHENGVYREGASMALSVNIPPNLGGEFESEFMRNCEVTHAGSCPRIQADKH